MNQIRKIAVGSRMVIIFACLSSLTLPDLLDVQEFVLMIGDVTLQVSHEYCVGRYPSSLCTDAVPMDDIRPHLSCRFALSHIQR